MGPKLDSKMHENTTKMCTTFEWDFSFFVNVRCGRSTVIQMWIIWTVQKKNAKMMETWKVTPANGKLWREQFYQLKMCSCNRMLFTYQKLHKKGLAGWSWCATDLDGCKTVRSQEQSSQWKLWKLQECQIIMHTVSIYSITTLKVLCENAFWFQLTTISRSGPSHFKSTFTAPSMHPVPPTWSTYTYNQEYDQQS